MKAIICVEIFEKIDWNEKGAYPNFNQALSNILEVNDPDTVIYDLDNFSEKMVIDYAQQLIEQAEEVCVLFKVRQEAPLKGLILFLQKLLRLRKKCSLAIQGTHTKLTQFLRPFYVPRANPAVFEGDELRFIEHWQNNSTKGLYSLKFD